MNTASLLAKKNQLFEGRPLPGELLPFLDQPGVSDIALGLKMRDGHFTDELSWVIYVHEKIAKAELSPGELIPGLAGGLPTDVQLEFDSWEFRFHNGSADSARYRNPLTGGIQIGTAPKGTAAHAGTLGCFARKNDDRSIVLLSNYHVIFAGQASKGDDIYQPGGESTTDNDSIATVDYGVIGGPVDCAIAILDQQGSSTCCCKRPMDYRQKITNIFNDPGITISGTRPPAVGTRVYKTGTHGRTVGKILTVGKNFPNQFDYTNSDLSAGQKFNFTNQTMIVTIDESTGNDLWTTPFLQDGDSGSVVTDNAGFVVGLAFATITYSDGNVYGLANDIHEVERALKITIFPDNPSGVALDPNSPLNSDESAVATADTTGSTVQIVWGKAPIPWEPIPEPTVHWVLDAFPELQVGERLEALIRKHAAEITTLVNQCRPVTLAWQRSQGPGWLNHLFNSLRSPAHRIPTEIKETTLPMLIENMRSVLHQHGSESLQADLHRYTDAFIEACADSDDAMRFLHHLNTRLCLPLQEH